MPKSGDGLANCDDLSPFTDLLMCGGHYESSSRPTVLLPFSTKVLTLSPNLRAISARLHVSKVVNQYPNS